MKDIKKEYLKHYSGKNRKAIFEAFCKFVEAFRSDNYEVLDEICTKDCIAHISMLGHIKGVEKIKEAMKWPGPFTAISRAQIFNFVARSYKNEGIQMAYIQGMRAVEEGDDVYPFQYGFHIINRFVCEDGSWKIRDIRMDLCYEAGNDLFVYGKWCLMDHFKYSGHEPMINPDEDNPWHVIPIDEEPMSDEEAVFDVMYQFTFAFDMGDFAFMKDIVTDDFILNEGPKRLERWDELNPGDRVEFREITDFLRYKYHKEARLMHAYRMGEIEFNGDRAIAYMPRGEEHRIKNIVINKENIHYIFTNMLAICGATKMKDGNWKINKYRVEMAQGNTVTPDDAILYDEYIISGGKACIK